MEQRTPEWHQVRLGIPTGSRIGDATAKTKTGWSSSRENYMAELLTERLTGQPAPQYSNAAMEFGTQVEPEARAAYEFTRNLSVQQIGFLPHPTLRSGASPDGVVEGNPRGLVEIKCPNTATHIATLLGAPIDLKYLKQMQWQMVCANAQWCDWVSYDPRLPDNLRMVIRRVPRDDKMIAGLELDIRLFIEEMDAKYAALMGLGESHLMAQLQASAA